ncbi:methylation [Pseudomonas sp. ATCC 13867]|uniref:GspH/FimT family pseudopilin n=1 Tax=Pseudomonas sp. ATCC 13867 TaxID=1294143 RepID=UPI0002C4ECDF|nr:GspH/FimT family pseudopilin [Pseudomonas sp. ATCC 13867]AGI22826.1 methylation [Pseudomonas sp. ATCC 13867]RFQ36112.1 prepilin-type N-terminal cleavage/methylation domain-containing protein [Pseudomonas sp. ATCC 13867]
MLKRTGFSLIELLVALAILAIALSIAAPGFGQLIEEHRLQVATQELQSALNQARATAALSGQPVSIAALEGNWAQGWTLFVDSNNNGVREPSEPLLSTHAALAHITVVPDATSLRYLHYTPGGYSIQPSGAFHSGHFVLCANTPSAARIVINRAGRIRREAGDANSLCPR